MREIRTYGSEGGVPQGIPTPIMVQRPLCFGRIGFQFEWGARWARIARGGLLVVQYVIMNREQEHNGDIEFGLGPAMVTLVPKPPLCHWIHFFWLFQGAPTQNGPTDPVVERLLPDGSMQWVINLDEDRLRVFPDANPTHSYTTRGALVTGTQSGFFLIDAGSRASLLGIHIKPGGALPFLPCDGEAIADRTEPLEAFWGLEAEILRERILEAPSPTLKFRVLEQTLLQRAFKPLQRHGAVAFALDRFQSAPENAPVSGVLDEIGMSRRHFSCCFRRHIGLTPKRYWRIQRFQRVIRRLHDATEVNWVDVALAAGYFDQAHFIRDFRTISGLSPTQYWRLRTSHRNHLPLQ